MTDLLSNYLGGRWQPGTGAGTPLFDPVLGTEPQAEILHDGSTHPPLDRDTAHASALVRRGKGSLVSSLYGSDAAVLANTALELADSHGRVHVISPDVAQLQTGHGNVMPQSVYGDPGRAGGGEELGGLRALNFYHRRSALQASTTVLTHLQMAH